MRNDVRTNPLHSYVPESVRREGKHSPQDAYNVAFSPWNPSTYVHTNPAENDCQTNMFGRFSELRLEC